MIETKSTAARLLVDCLVEQGCDRIFTVPGESFLPVLDALFDTPSIQLVTCRQEGGAGFMACADGTITGRPGVCFVTRGPGATNASIAVHVAMQDSQPLILFVGDVDSRMRDREGFQEMDFAAFFAPVSKWAARIDDPARIPEYIARAYSTAISGRPGPVVLALPEDMLSRTVAAAARPISIPLPLMPDLGESPAQDIIERIRQAKRPVAIVGGAGWDVSTGLHFASFAERWGIPVAAAFRRQDAIDNNCPVWAGNLGYGPNPKLVRRIKEADLLLVVGARLGEATTDGYTLITPDHPGQTLIHVHPDPEELNRVYHADFPVCCDVGVFADMLTGLRPLEQPFSGGAEAHAEWIEWSTPNPSGDALDLGLCVTAMREALPGDSIICNGAGNFSGWWHRYWHYARQPTQLAPTAGAMGYGVPAAVAAKLRLPERMVVAVAGDGDFLMNGQELATAVQHRVDLLVIVVDNSAYGTIRMHQEREFPGRVAATVLANPDFAKLAEAYGGWSARVETTAEFAPALKDALGRKGLRLLHLVTDIERLNAAGATVAGLRAR